MQCITDIYVKSIYYACMHVFDTSKYAYSRYIYVCIYMYIYKMPDIDPHMAYREYILVHSSKNTG